MNILDENSREEIERWRERLRRDGYSEREITKHVEEYESIQNENLKYLKLQAAERARRKLVEDEELANRAAKREQEEAARREREREEREERDRINAAKLVELNSLAERFPPSGNYSGDYSMFVPAILKLWDDGLKRGKITDTINEKYRVHGLHPRIYPEMVGHILLREGKRIKKPRPPSAKQIEQARWAEIQQRIQRNRPLDMGGPRDVWQVWTPEMQAREFGLI